MLTRYRKRLSAGEYSERYSVTSKKSERRRTSNTPQLLQRKWLGRQEYLLIFVEASTALAAYVIADKIYLEEPMTTRREITGTPSQGNLTVRETTIRLIYFKGYSALVSIFIGCIADSYLSYYTVALSSVILHFGTLCVIMVEHIIVQAIDDGDVERVYGNFMGIVCIIALVLIKSTDFTRLVYGLENMHTATRSAVGLFTFLQFMVGSYATYGGIFVNVFSAVIHYFNIDTIVLSFTLTGLSLLLFVYCLYPEVRLEEHRGLGCKVVGCILLAIYCNIFRKKKHKGTGFFEKTLRTCNEETISKTRNFIRLFVALLSTIGMALFIMQPIELFIDLTKIKIEEVIKVAGLTELARATLSIGMLISYFVLWPLIALTMRLKNKEQLALKFILGYFLTAMSMFVEASIMKDIEILPYSSNTAYVRIFNARESPVEIIHRYRNVITKDILIAPQEGVMLSYQSRRSELVPVEVLFNDTRTNFTTFLSVEPGEITGYMVLDPPMIVKIRGFLPLREGPEGTNKGSWPRIYIYNTALTLYGAWIEVKHSHEKKILSKVQIQPGALTTIALEPSTYDFRIPKADIRREITVHEGGLYGMMIYTASTIRRMTLDTVEGENTASCWPLIGLCFMMGLAMGISYPALRETIFLIAPDGLTAMSIAVISFLEGISLWIIYIGFKTWHRFMTANDLFAYASFVTANFLFFTFFYLKFKVGYEKTVKQRFEYRSI